MDLAKDFITTESCKLLLGTFQLVDTSRRIPDIRGAL